VGSAWRWKGFGVAASASPIVSRSPERARRFNRPDAGAGIEAVRENDEAPSGSGCRGHQEPLESGGPCLRSQALCRLPVGTHEILRAKVERRQRGRVCLHRKSSMNICSVSDRWLASSACPLSRAGAAAMGGGRGGEPPPGALTDRQKLRLTMRPWGSSILVV
jgi:hypothetical protein